MLAIIPKKNISTGDLKTLRSISNVSISEIKQAAVDQKPIKLFKEFEGSWEVDRLELARLVKEISEVQDLPYQLALVEDLEIMEFLSAEKLYDYLRHLREIELETQRNSDLENGYISSPDDFEPHDEDWVVV
ncbi:hypothetical protein [Fulvivirga sediminis]|uniref:Uncharacterized protein n=1 Tax=Fulvivirga sediminis TaxID=2803949 RepID=A0A937K010_9BACT|nr:hypothetical protein [Fulvivirga sediminis]MBL3655811.1 hypothetical protein [Fulvivirga sediminis]